MLFRIDPAAPAIHCEVVGVITNTMLTAHYRGAGRPEASYVIETMVDLAARQIGQRLARDSPAREFFAHPAGDFLGSPLVEPFLAEHRSAASLRTIAHISATGGKGLPRTAAPRRIAAEIWRQ